MLWFGEFPFELGQTKYWRINERFIAIQRSKKEWTIWDKQTKDDTNQSIIVDSRVITSNINSAQQSRYMVTETSDTLLIEPSLADRAVVATPSIPLVVMPQETIEVYVSTPLWMSIFIASSDTLIADIPFWLPSDSWFGPSTMKGDLCYSKYTDAKVDLSSLDKHSCRAITEVRLRNDQAQPLRIEKLNLPVPSLKIYANKKGEFWTDCVSIVQCEEHGKPISLVTQSQPASIQGDEQVFESRVLSVKPSLFSSIKNLVG
jgi:hypothetical protein